jgi:hypothetical protein
MPEEKLNTHQKALRIARTDTFSHNGGGLLPLDPQINFRPA